MLPESARMMSPSGRPHTYKPHADLIDLDLIRTHAETPMTSLRSAPLLAAIASACLALPAQMAIGQEAGHALAEKFAAGAEREEQQRKAAVDAEHRKVQDAEHRKASDAEHRNREDAMPAN